VTGAALAEGLRAWLGERVGDPRLAVTGLRRHTEGFSWETYTLEASWRDPATGARRREGLAVRAEPADGLLAPYDIEGQYRLHEALLRSAVPMPGLRWLELDPGALGRPFYVMDRVEGNVPVQWRPDDPAIFPDADAVHRFGRAFVDVHAEIHAVDWRGLGIGFLAGDEDPAASAAAQLERWIASYEDSATVEIPVFREAIEWLRHELRPTAPLVLCHGDYRIGNVMERDGAIVAVFDWELAHVGDPIEDIAYAGLPLWRGRDRRISHLLEPEEYFERYEARTGTRVEPDAFHAWTVFGLLKAGACHLRGARAFEQGRSSDLRLAALGHQVGHVARQLGALLGARA
jgi:aminoglycoside phosphotransferase (APT) family kinase protein